MTLISFIKKLRVRTRARRWIHSLRESIEFRPDGFPFPPLELRALVSGDAENSKTQFQKMGAACFDRIVASLRKENIDIADFKAILDFGCGCGRTIRHFRHLKSIQLYGTDYNPRLINWCREQLPFAQFDLNQLAPPLDYANSTFDLVYAFSVFTHLPESLQHAWIAELSRVLKPKRFLAISLLGLDWLPAERKTGDLVVLNEERAGANECSSYHAFAYVAGTLAKDFDVVDFVERGIGQDFYLLRKK